MLDGGFKHLLPGSRVSAVRPHLKELRGRELKEFQESQKDTFEILGKKKE